jgi:hypothetical protein
MRALPGAGKSLEKILKIFELVGLAEKGGCTGVIGTSHRGEVIQLTDDKYQGALKTFLIAKPAQKFETVHPWHLQIEKNDSRQRVLLPVFVRRRTFEISNGINAGANRANGIRDTETMKTSTKEFDVIR